MHSSIIFRIQKRLLELWKDVGIEFRVEIYFKKLQILLFTSQYTECPRRNGQNFGRVFLMLKYTDITQNTYIQS